MISQVEFLSCDHRPADYSPREQELSGPPFGEYLARAEKDSDGSWRQTETAGTSEDRQTDGSINSEDSKNTKPADSSVESTRSKESDAPEKTGKVQTDNSGKKSEESPAQAKTDKEETVRPALAEKTTQKEKALLKRKGDKREEIRVSDQEADKKDAVGEKEESGIAIMQQKAAESASTMEKPLASELADESPGPEGETGEDLEVPGMTASGGVLSAGSEEAAEGFEKRDENNRRKSAELRSVQNRGKSAEQTVKTEVIDLRTAKDGKNEQLVSQSLQKPENVISQESLQPDGQNRQDFVVIEASTARADGLSSRGDLGPAQTAADLSRALKEEGNGEILKKAQFLLKDRDQGEIRLILKPEKLGEVRIRLNLSDNRHIAGRIIVENSSVRDVFQENMEALSRAFRESGFQTAGLDVSVGQREGFSEKRKGQSSDTLPVEKLTKIFEEQVPRVEDLIFGESRVNVYV